MSFQCRDWRLQQWQLANYKVQQLMSRITAKYPHNTTNLEVYAHAQPSSYACRIMKPPNTFLKRFLCWGANSVRNSRMTSHCAN